LSLPLINENEALVLQSKKEVREGKEPAGDEERGDGRKGLSSPPFEKGIAAIVLRRNVFLGH